MKLLIMCEGPNELEVIRILLENDKLKCSADDLLNLVPYHARQITSSTVVQTAMKLYPGEVKVLRIGDTLKDELKIPKDYKDRIVEVEKYCTKPELEMLFIIAEQMESEFEKVKSTTSPKTFSKEHIVYNRRRYDNSTSYYRHYFGDRAELLVESIKRYKQLKGKHQRGELYLADLLK